MTQKELMTAVRDMGLSCTAYEGEYRIAYRIPHSEASAYYTTDRQDALDTARAMVKQSLVVEV